MAAAGRRRRRDVRPAGGRHLRKGRRQRVGGPRLVATGSRSTGAPKMAATFGRTGPEKHLKLEMNSDQDRDRDQVGKSSDLVWPFYSPASLRERGDSSLVR